MSARAARVLGIAVIAACVLAVLGAIPIGLAARDRIEPGQIVVVGDEDAPRVQELVTLLEEEGGPLDASTQGYNVGFGALIVLLLAWMGVGLLIVWRVPNHWAGWLFLITGTPFPLLTLMQGLVVYGVKADPGSVPLVGLWAFLGEYLLYPIALLPLLFLLYPDGHPPSHRWRWTVVGLLGGTALAFAGFLVRPGPFNNWVGDGILYVNPLGIEQAATVAEIVIIVGTIVALLSGLSMLVAVRQRYRRAVGEERQRMRWLAFVAAIAGTLFASMWVFGFAAEALFGGGDEELAVFPILFGLTAFTLVVGVPAAYLVAIFRHGLWELDLVIRKTVQYAILVVLLTALAAVLVAAVPTLILGVGGDGVPILPVLLTAAALALGFLWLRPRVARLADRVVYGKRATPYEVLSAFSERVGGTFSTDDVLPRMAQLVAEATGATRVDVWLRVGGEMRPEVSWPDGVAAAAARPLIGDAAPVGDDEHGVEVRHRNELLGAITLVPAADEPIDPAKEALVGDLAAQAGLVLRNVRLIEELRASRQRLVAAQDAERRRLERNIHDGVQQQLVALSVQLRLVEQLADRDPAKAKTLAVDLQGRATDALEELRDLARGIYPPLLADQGLPAALAAQARKAPLPVEVEAGEIGRFPQAVEAAVYFSVLEALNNVAKYADASRVTVALDRANGSLSFRVADDGRGFDAGARSYGTGLQGIADRLDAIGGELSVASTPGEGTRIEGRVPVEPSA